MPDTDHPLTPEPAYLTLENVKKALVKFLLSLTDDRVKREKAPFDRPEIFVPIDGLAPENAGRANLIALSAPGATCTVAGGVQASPCNGRRGPRGSACKLPGSDEHPAGRRGLQLQRVRRSGKSLLFSY